MVTARGDDIHVSGHPAQDELAQMYQWVRPKVAVPVHGESRHLYAHAKFARACQVPQTVVVHNGDLVRLAPGDAEIIDEVYSGRLALDGNRLIDLDSHTIRDRRKMTFHGSAVATVILDGKGNLHGEPIVSVIAMVKHLGLQ